MKSNHFLNADGITRVFRARSFWFAALFFGFFWLLDFPKPFIDDLFFCGTALNLAGGGGPTNPLLGWFPGQPFFIQPPVHSYFLAGWLKVFGVSASALTGFQAAMYFCVAAAVIAILRKNQSPAWLEFLVPLVVTAAFLDSGLRQEPMAAALTLAGFALIECGARRAPLVFLALLLLFLGGVTAPRMALFGAALVLLSGQRLWRDARDHRQRGEFFLLGLGALLLAGLIFLWMIHFRIAEFWQVFHLVAQIVVSNQRQLSFALHYHFGITQQLYLLLAVIMSFFAFKHRSENLIQVCIAIGLAFPIEFFNGYLGYGAGTLFALLMIFSLSAVLWKQASRAARVVLPLALGSLLIWVNAPKLAEVSGILTGNIQSSRGDQYEEARALTSTEAHPLVLDPMAARYVFGYKLPPGSLDFFFCAPFPKFNYAIPYQPRDNYLLSPRWYDYAVQTGTVEARPRPQWSLLKWSFDRYPCKVYVVRADTWKVVKTTPEIAR